MLVVRPAGPADLDHLLELAILSGPGFTSLPEDPDALADRLELALILHIILRVQGFAL